MKPPLEQSFKEGFSYYTNRGINKKRKRGFESRLHPKKTDKYSHISKGNPIKNHQYKSGESGNLSGIPKGSLNRKTVARMYLAFQKNN